MKRTITTLALLALTLVLVGCSGNSHGGGLTPASDLAGDGAAGEPIIIAFVGRDCPYCEYVEQRHLRPMEREVERGARDPVTIRVVDIHDDRSLRDFSGKEVSVAAFRQRHGIRFTPTLLFFDPSGEQQAEPLIGMNSEDYYGGYVEERLAEVRDSLR